MENNENVVSVEESKSVFHKIWNVFMPWDSYTV